MTHLGHSASAFNVLDHGAIGDGQTLNTTAIQAAIEACHQSGGTVYFPSGHYLTGSLILHSHVTLHLDSGATLLGSPDPADYPVIDSRWEGADRKTYAPLIGGSHLDNVAIAGRGTVDGQGETWWRLHRENKLEHPRPRLISFADCSNVLIESITATRSPAWTIHPIRCENVTVDKVTIISPADSPNTDGINPDSCRDVRIFNCHISVGDDCIAVKSGTKENGGRLAPCENIAIANCTMAHGHGGVVIGSETSGDIRNVVISNCVFAGTDRGIRLKSRRGRGGLVEDIRVTNVVMENVLCPLTMNLYYACGAWGDETVADKGFRPVDDGTPRFRHIHLSHITARQVKLAAAFLYGLPEMPIEDLSLANISISLSRDGAAGYPEMADGMELMRRAGVFVRNARGLRLCQVEVEGQLGPAITLMDARDVDLSACTSRTPCAEAPVIWMKGVSGAFVHDCRAGAGTDVFVHVEGERSQDILLNENDLTLAGRAIRLGQDAPTGAVSA